jgi:hypothetical protein
VTECELLDLANAGKLDAAGVSEFTAKIMKDGASERSNPAIFPEH